MSKIEIQLPDNFELFTDSIIERGWIGEAGKNQHYIMGAVSKIEARTLAAVILEYNCQKSFETGVANGISTLAITQAIALTNGHHYGIDPYQFTYHKGTALNLLAEHDLLDYFTLCEGSTHLEAPKLLSKHDEFDFAFIDGMHTFDYKFIDFFYADKLLKAGGLLVFHDSLLPSVKKIFRFIKKNKKYRVLTTPELQPNLSKKAKYMLAAFIKGKPYWYEWNNNFCNLLVLQKICDIELPWYHFEDF